MHFANSPAFQSSVFFVPLLLAAICVCFLISAALIAAMISVVYRLRKIPKEKQRLANDQRTLVVILAALIISCSAPYTYLKLWAFSYENDSGWEEEKRMPLRKPYDLYLLTGAESHACVRNWDTEKCLIESVLNVGHNNTHVFGERRGIPQWFTRV